MMRQQFPLIFHAFDVWQSLLKKLVKCSKAFPKVGLWTKTIINHFWWCCRECKGNESLLIEILHSYLLHVLNIYNWGNMHSIHERINKMKKETPLSN